MLLSILAIAAGIFVSNNIFERLPHIEDEWAYLWQARLAANGQLMIPSPQNAPSVFVPFVVDYHGWRFGKYPPGWPIILGLGGLLGIKDLVNPLLAGMGIWLTYLLGRKLLNPQLGLLAALLTATSPFYLINAGSYLSHVWMYVLSATFSLAWLDIFPLKISDEQTPKEARLPSWMLMVLAGSSLGVMIITRPITAAAVALPFFFYGVYLLIKGDRANRLKVLGIGALAVPIGALFFVWQFAVTGDPFLNPYTLWWPYDKYGFGPGYGIMPSGHTFALAIDNILVSLNAGRQDIFGWGVFSWLFLPFGYWAVRRQPAFWIVGSVFWSLLVAYFAYWVGAGAYGPRYYFEGLYSLTLVNAAGFGWLAGWYHAPGEGHAWRNFSALGTILLLAGLVGYNLFAYLPKRLDTLNGLYGVDRAMLAPFEKPEVKELAPALVIIHETQAHGWRDYGVFAAAYNDPWLTSPFIFAISRGHELDAVLRATYPDRTMIDYYMDGVIHIKRASDLEQK